MLKKSLPALFFISIMTACNSGDSNNENIPDMNEHFSPVAWSHSTNIYEVNLRQYSPEGTFAAFANSLPRLKEMGVEVLWLMPLTPISKKNMKGEMGSYYACSDYKAINPEFGTMDDFKNLVKQAHGMGMKVIIDWVANHTGWDHRWTREHPDWYEMDSATHDFKIASGMDDIIELDFTNPDLRRAMTDAMKFWVTECDIDGFRADLAFWVALDFWIEARTELEKTKKLFWLGELDPLENPEYMGAFDAAYTWTWMHRAKDFYQKKLPIASLDSVLQQYEAIGNKTMRAWFTTNHDENSWNGTEYEKYGDMAMALAVFSCTWNGLPLLYSGQELPNTKRLEFFKKDPIAWTGIYQLHDFYKKLLNLHSVHPALRAGDEAVTTTRIKTSDDERVFAFLRKNGEHEVLVLLHLSPRKNLQVDITDAVAKGKFSELFTGESKDFSADRKLMLQPWGYFVFVK